MASHGLKPVSRGRRSMVRGGEAGVCVRLAGSVAAAALARRVPRLRTGG